MRIGFVSTRLAGTDGVSLETRKWAAMFRRLGHEVFFCAGELDADLPGMVEPLMHFQHPVIRALNAEAFAPQEPSPAFFIHLDHVAQVIERRLAEFVALYRVQVLVVENALTIPMNLALGEALRRYLARSEIRAIVHHHDFYWERERFAVHQIPELLDTAFPPHLPNLQHVVINRVAQRALYERRGITSVVVPNVFDFAQAAPGISRHNADLRRVLGLDEEQHLLVLQPTRVVRRKGIELALHLVRELRKGKNRRRLLNKEPVLVISHHAGDEGWEYLEELKALARRWRVPLYYAAPYFQAEAKRKTPRFFLWDAYVHADFVTYPSLYEGFGNALLEAVYFRLPVMVNRYHVFVQDIAPLGFDFIEINREVTQEVVERTIAVLRDPVRRRRMVEHNYQLAREHFSYEAVLPTLAALLEGNAVPSESPPAQAEEGRGEVLQPLWK